MLQQHHLTDGDALVVAAGVRGARHRGVVQRHLSPEHRQPGPRHRDVGLEDAEPYARTGIESAEERVLAAHPSPKLIAAVQEETRQAVDAMKVLLEEQAGAIPLTSFPQIFAFKNLCWSRVDLHVRWLDENCPLWRV